jgi:hypothetical protein
VRPANSAGGNPCLAISDDGGASFRCGGKLLTWPVPAGDPKYTGIDGGRPYVKYAADGAGAIHFLTTEDHPRAYDNSIWHGVLRGDRIHASDGTPIVKQRIGSDGALRPNELTLVFAGDADHVAWTIDLHLDRAGRPFCLFSIQRDSRGPQRAARGMDHRYGYARWDGVRWEAYEICHAGTRLYAAEDAYTGLATLDPQDPDTVYVSTNADPLSGEPLISKADGRRHHEIIRGTTPDRGRTWRWQAVTRDSTADNIRPVVPINDSGRHVVLWLRGSYATYQDYQLDVVGTVD